MEFNNREISSLIWILVAFIFCLINQKTRDSLLNILQIALNPKILLLFFSAILFNFIIILFLEKVGFWNSYLLKETLQSSLVIFPYVSKWISIHEKDISIKKQITKIVSFIIILEFILSFNSFSLPVELIFVPLFSIVAGMEVYSRLQNKTEIHRIFSTIITIIILTLIALSTKEILSGFNEINWLAQVKQLAIGPVLVFLNIPLMYIFGVYSMYEIIFIRLNFFIEDKDLSWKTKKSIIYNCKLDIKKLKKMSERIRNLGFQLESEPEKLFD